MAGMRQLGLLRATRPAAKSSTVKGDPHNAMQNLACVPIVRMVSGVWIIVPGSTHAIIPAMLPAINAPRFRVTQRMGTAVAARVANVNMGFGAGIQSSNLSVVTFLALATKTA